jgi:hypothetical protein
MIFVKPAASGPVAGKTPSPFCSAETRRRTNYSGIGTRVRHRFPRPLGCGHARTIARPGGPPSSVGRLPWPAAIRGQPAAKGDRHLGARGRAALSLRTSAVLGATARSGARISPFPRRWQAMPGCALRPSSTRSIPTMAKSG